MITHHPKTQLPVVRTHRGEIIIGFRLSVALILLAASLWGAVRPAQAAPLRDTVSLYLEPISKLHICANR